ncbi:4Fe-4S cluster-binding domain-containing protein [Geobacter argillaceus]|uniref:Putative pyruvate formate lyase activating enzyme n=1 Tax=Geobacter argillaceus TaxID=345631 RepID=A0A562VMZ7_9BACT|nr:4Fe-4S cluster-binding domain-containing protein [Geobacter argillaceus]TWJ19172.1 putative pyruvate formate lyase activating enzyme [Geobacter argillaceus]
MSYHDLYQSGELLRRIRVAYDRLRSCDLCPHDCGVNRLKGERGLCGAGLLPKIASANVHRGEEPPISGTRGSGTIFFSGCSLSCRFCQNFPISQLGNGEEIATRELARRMLQLQQKRVHNINFVTPTHFQPQILAALWLAIPDGFSLPIVWNSSGYEKVELLTLLDGVANIYLPDMKYAVDEPAKAISGATGYPGINRRAVTEMLRQVGHLQLDDEGIAKKGLIIRHLVLPGDLAGSAATLHWIAANLGTETHVALMSQYFPAHSARETPGMDRHLTADEYDAAVEALEEAGLENGWVQELDTERKPV